MGYILITNSVAPYARDVLGVMAQYPGSTYRFRYETLPGLDLIGKSVKATRMPNSRGLIVLRDWHTGQLYPIRHIRISEVLPSPTLLVVRFLVDEFANALQKDQLVEFRTVIENQAEKKNPGNDLAPLIYEVSDEILDRICRKEKTSQGGSASQWRSVIDSICECAEMQQYGYLFLHSIRDQENQSEVQEQSEGQVLVNADSVYKCRILSYIALKEDGDSNKKKGSSLSDAVEELKIQMNVDDKVIAPIVGESSIVSRYDEHVLTFRNLNTAGGIWTHIRFLTKQDDDTKGTKPLYFPAIDLDLAIKVSVWQRLAIIVGIMALGAAVFVPKDYDYIIKGLQAIGLLLIAAPGKDFYGVWTKRLVNASTFRAAASDDTKEAAFKMKMLNFFPYYEDYLRRQVKTTTIRLHQPEFLIGDQVDITIGWNENDPMSLCLARIISIDRKQIKDLTTEDFEGESPDCLSPEPTALVISSIYRTSVTIETLVWIVKFAYV